ncbi:MAG: hypothetical protein F6K10_24325 [Moorea sp. SIO2B7]|nr:hypothetical protein [Moorena sp. SIO2B7]
MPVWLGTKKTSEASEFTNLVAFALESSERLKTGNKSNIQTPMTEKKQ